MTTRCHDLAALTNSLRRSPGVHRSDVEPGDVLVVKTRNSVYAVRVLTGRSVSVSGGWFDRKYGGPYQTTISGCTWGGCILQRDLMAACGMHLEFGNRVVTSTIQKVCHFRRGHLN